jgi:iron complex outermembrane recepter protein
VSWIVFLAAVQSARGQQQQPPQPDPHTFTTAVEVVGVTPLHGIGLPATRVPANVQVLGMEWFDSGAPELPALLVERATSVHLNDAQGGTFQPDLQFRGFAASPLLGASEGLAIYQDACG